MVAKEFCVHPAMSWFFNTMQAIPVNRRGVDTAATKLAIRYASQGDLVGLFPEGRINDTGALLLPGRPGAALIALKARVPVVPVICVAPERRDQHGGPSFCRPGPSCGSENRSIFRSFTVARAKKRSSQN